MITNDHRLNVRPKSAQEYAEINTLVNKVFVTLCKRSTEYEELYSKKEMARDIERDQRSYRGAVRGHLDWIKTQRLVANSIF